MAYDIFLSRMNNSPIRHKSREYCNSHDFDYQEEFNQFLEEAKKNAGKGTSNITQDEQSDKEEFNRKQKYWKSWRSLLFTWLKPEWKSKSGERKMNGRTIAKTRGHHVSGPVQGSSRGIASGRAALRAVSGPLTCIFSSTNEPAEYEVPYTCLAQINNTRKQIHPYGPIYLVT